MKTNKKVKAQTSSNNKRSVVRRVKRDDLRDSRVPSFTDRLRGVSYSTEHIESKASIDEWACSHKDTSNLPKSKVINKYLNLKD